MKKLLSVLLSIAILIGVALTVSGACVGEIYADKAAEKEFIALSEAQQNAVAASSILYDSFPYDDDWNKIYPEDYAGCYIENNILYICIVDLPDRDISAYQALLADYQDDILFQNAAHSLSTLKRASRAIAEELRAEGVHVTGWGISPVENAVSIRVEPGELPSANRYCTKSAGRVYYAQSNDFPDIPIIFREEAGMGPCSG